MRDDGAEIKPGFPRSIYWAGPLVSTKRRGKQCISEICGSRHLLHIFNTSASQWTAHEDHNSFLKDE